MGKTKEEEREENLKKHAEKLAGGPVEERGCTDILCCLIFIAYMILMIVLAAEGWTDGEPYKLVAAWDSSWNPCGIKTDEVDLTDYKYIYFAIPHPDHLNKTTCVKECPNYADEASKPTSLECNLHNNTMFSEYGCEEVCSPFSAASSSSTSDSGWSAGSSSVTLNWNKLMCIYNTTTIMNRLCFPGTAIFKVVNGLTTAFSKSINMDQLTSWMNDVDKGLGIIYASFGIIFLLGLLYMGFIRLFSGVIVWLIILIFFVLLAALGVYLYNQHVAIDDNIKKNDGIEYDQNTKDTRDTYLYASYAVCFIWFICLIVFMCTFRNIKLAIAVIKTATIFTVQTPTAMAVPPVMAILTIIWWLVWILAFVFVYAVGTLTKRSESSIFAKVIHEDIQVYKIWGFIFGGLWVNAFLQALTQFILASTVSIWYWSQPEASHKPVSRSVYRAFRYHLGSLAFGSFILAIVQTIRLMLEYVYRQSQAAGADKNKITRCILKCLRCCMACFERFIQFLTKTAYVQMALSGQNFCSSAKEGMQTVWANASRVSLCSGLGGAFIFVGKIFMICFNVYICYIIYTNVDPYKTEMQSTFLPLLIIFVFSWGISTIFMSVYGMAIDTILMCFLYDEKNQKGNTEAHMKAPATLKDFFSEHDAKVDARRKQEEKAAAKA